MCCTFTFTFKVQTSINEIFAGGSIHDRQLTIMSPGTQRVKNIPHRQEQLLLPYLLMLLILYFQVKNGQITVELAKVKVESWAQHVQYMIENPEN